jgi:hypothetical protein
MSVNAEGGSDPGHGEPTRKPRVKAGTELPSMTTVGTDYEQLLGPIRARLKSCEQEPYWLRDQLWKA